MKDKIKGLLLGCGYVEEQKLSLLPVYHEEGFSSPAEAIHHCARSLIDARDFLYPASKGCKECGHGEAPPLYIKAFFAEHYWLDLDRSFDVHESLKAYGWTLDGHTEPGIYAIVNNFDAYLEALDEGREPRKHEGEVVGWMSRVALEEDD